MKICWCASGVPLQVGSGGYIVLARLKPDPATCILEQRLENQGQVQQARWLVFTSVKTT